MSLPRLPSELWNRILAQLSPSNLTSVSLVCRSWRTHAFPYLYHTVYLCFAADLEELVLRILYEDDMDAFPVTPHVKGLVLDAEFLDDEAMDEYVDEDEAVRITEGNMDNLKTLASRLIQLQTYDFDEDFAEALPKVLASSPNLTSLKLDFESKSGERRYNPNTLIAALGDKLAFPHLHTFHARGGAVPDWYEFFASPESSTYPLRTFLARHAGIRDLALGNVPGGRLYDKAIPPEELAQLFPSVVHFEGPTFLLCGLVLSSIAPRLESLALNNFELCLYEDSGPLSGLRGKISLPRLRRFAILAWEVAEKVQWDILEIIIDAAPQLEEIEAKASSQCFKEKDILTNFFRASRLRVLAISSDFVPQADRFETTDTELVSFTTKLAHAFPRLETVKYGEPYTRERACAILRTRSGLRVRCERARTIRPN
ncbi:hypothetical protein FRC11_010233 [Ceratobasidium sp. 423]|nr:hypothetical protein FRC11_010233 [Ceratobasidium sp. 423]